MKNKQLDKSTVPVGKKNGITGTGRQRQSNDSQQINKTDRDKWERKMHNGHREQGQRIETQTIRQIYRDSREKEWHNGHGRQTQSNDSQQINKRSEEHTSELQSQR